MASMHQLKQDFFNNLANKNQFAQQQVQNQNNGAAKLPSILNDQNAMIRQTVLHGKKGYDLRLFLDSLVASKFLCCICKKVCRDAQELSCSSAHIFCKQCIDQHFQVAQISNKAPQCPICHETQDSNNPTQRIAFRTSRFVNNHIKELQVKCIQCHDNIACNWNGRLGDLSKHMSSECMFSVIECPFALLGCPQSRLYKYQLKDHLSNITSCNKHIALALQKIKNLKLENSEKSEMNNKMMGQLRAIKAISKNKETKINVMSKELDTLKETHKQLLVEYSKMNEDNVNANNRISQYEKAVALLKQANEKLMKEIELLKMQQNHQAYASMPDLSGYNASGSMFGQPGMASGGSGMDMNGLLGGGGGSNQMAGMNKNANSLEYLVSNMSLESEKKVESEQESDGLSSKRVLFEFVKMHKDLPKQFNDMANNALVQPTDDEASRFVRILLESDKHPQFKQDIATIVSKLQKKR